MSNESTTEKSGNSITLEQAPRKTTKWSIAISVLLAAGILYYFFFFNKTSATPPASDQQATAQKIDSIEVPKPAGANMTPIDTALYNQKVLALNNGDSSGLWPVKAVYPTPGAILPFSRIVAFYGNLYSKNMGILGELPRAQMLAKLKQEVAKWEKADPSTPVQPALHYIAVTAQGSPGKNGKYRLRMPFNQIDTVLSMAKEINAIVFLDVQVGLGTLQEEIPALEKYLSMPNVHLGIDPEFSMKGGQRPGLAVGTFDASDINYVSEYLAQLVKKNNLPPKVLVLHRFTQRMMTNYKEIKKRPEVQLVVHMDGWGFPAKKLTTYRMFIHNEPVQFTGFKLFYKNDLRDNGRLLTPEELMKLKPLPVYIQYQ